MTGWLYRRAVGIKDFGERVRCGALVKIGLWMREKVMRLSIKSYRR
jgi:hypothetical protein